jgi:hypothetical protein
VRAVRGWRAFEDHVNALLGLDPTVASGSQFYDKGDGVDRSEGDFAIQVDAKYTEAKSFSVNGKLLTQWCQRAQLSGKRFVLAVRLWNPSLNSGDDYAVIRLDDLAELLEKAKERQDG